MGTTERDSKTEIPENHVLDNAAFRKPRHRALCVGPLSQDAQKEAPLHMLFQTAVPGLTPCPRISLLPGSLG